MAAALSWSHGPWAAQPALGASAVVTQGEHVRVRHETLRLANGFEVILVEDHRLPLVAFNLWVHAGPRNEAKGQTGFAHLFEHLMFAGSKHIPRGEADKIIDAAGGTDSNGTTNFDRTNYFFYPAVKPVGTGAVDQIRHAGLHDRPGRRGGAGQPAGRGAQ